MRRRGQRAAGWGVVRRSGTTYVDSETCAAAPLVRTPSYSVDPLALHFSRQLRRRELTSRQLEEPPEGAWARRRARRGADRGRSQERWRRQPLDRAQRQPERRRPFSIFYKIKLSQHFYFYFTLHKVLSRTVRLFLTWFSLCPVFCRQTLTFVPRSTLTEFLLALILCKLRSCLDALKILKLY